MDAVKHYGATTLAAVVALIAIAGGLLLFAQGDGESERIGILVTLIGGVVTSLLATQRGEAATHAARRADVGVQDAKVALDIAVAETAQTTPVALAALREVLERTERKVDAVVKNGNGNGHPEGPG